MKSVIHRTPNAERTTVCLRLVSLMLACLRLAFIYWKGQHFIVFGVRRSADILLLPIHTHTTLNDSKAPQKKKIPTLLFVQLIDTIYRECYGKLLQGIGCTI